MGHIHAPLSINFMGGGVFIFISFKVNRTIVLFCALAIVVLSFSIGFLKDIPATNQAAPKVESKSPTPKKEFIKWVDFRVTDTAMRKAMRLDIESFGKDVHLDWIELLSILGAKYGGDFSKFQSKDLDSLANRLKVGEKIEDITRDMKYYPYYHEAYSAVLKEFVGEYEVQELSKDTGQIEYNKKYGLKAFSPIAKGYGYSHYDDFGTSRSYGYKRKHLGHDMMGNVGTPIVAVESGTVEAIGWNQYGGWRIGIRSFDRKRYYYYAHLRKNHPYPIDLSIGHTVKAGDVIGYLGMTGYSAKENTNNIDTPHLHFGIQLIFDESQKDGNGEIWIDCYEITKFLSQNSSATSKEEQTGEIRRKYDFWEKSVENME